MDWGVEMKKILSLLMAFSLVLGSLSGADFGFLLRADAASNEDPTLENNTEDVFAALGFDTGDLPEGYDSETTGNPFGRDKTTGNQVFEVLLATAGGTKLYGNNNNTVAPTALGSYSTSGASMPTIKMFSSTAGDFNGDGLPGEVAYVGIERQYYGVSTAAPLVLYVYDSATNTYSGAKSIGGVSPYYTVSGSTSQREYQTRMDASWQNLLQITAGDYDGDGISEIAVYVGENGNARVDIYKYQKASDSPANAWLTIGNWSRVWSYAVSSAQYAVPNMVSLISGDFSRDGVDDLGISYGRAVYNVFPTASLGVSVNYQAFNYTGLCIESSPSNARILWGGTSGMLQTNSALDLGSSKFGNLNRVSLAYGDVDADGTKDLVMAGQPADDKNANYQRAVGFYTFDEEAGLVLTTSQLIKVVDTENQTIPTYDSNGNPTGDTTLTSSKNGYDTKNLSAPAMRCNTAVVTPDRSSYTYIYIDSVLCKYLNSSLSIAYELDDDTSCDGGSNKVTLPWAGTKDVASYYYNNSYNNMQSFSYCEYGAVSGDMNGSGHQILLTNYMGTSNVLNTGLEPADGSYNGYRGSFKGYSVLYKGGTLGVSSINQPSTGGLRHLMTTTPVCVSMPDTDKDTTLIEYSGIHYLTYSDPKVLAVIAAAPYFKDVDIISDYDYAWQNTTSFSSISGSGHADLVSVDFEIGGYFEGDYTIAGAAVAIEAAAGFTMEWEHATTTSHEYTLTFETSQDEDSVAFYCIPTECYVYYVSVPDGIGGYTTTSEIISNSFSPCFQILSLDYYESIQGDYDALPQISGKAITSTPGYPSTYPSSTSGYNVLMAWNQDPAGVSFGNGAITQEITVTKEVSDTFNFGANVEFKVGAGGQGWSSLVQSGAHVKAGAYFSLNPAGGFSTIDLTGTSISGTVANMPTQFQDYGYYYSWKIFSYQYTFSDGTSVPVVSYVVGDVSEPPRLPTDFKQDYERSESDTNCLTWTYSGSAKDFYLYRYGDFPEGSGLQLIATIGAGDSTHYRLVNGKKEFYFNDENLTPYTEYRYCIQVERSSPVPPLSAPSAYLTARTKAADGNPILTVAESDGTNDTNLLVYPDKNSYLTVGITGPNGQLSTNYYTTVLYQWQKQVEGAWTELDNETSRTLTFASAGVASAGVYRCRVNSVTKDSATYITSYTGSVVVTHSKRATHISQLWAHDTASAGVELYAKVVNNHADSAAIPAGMVLFTLTSGSTGVSYQYVEALDSNGVANPVIDEGLPEGVYSVYAYYSGSYVFKPSEAQSIYLSDMGSGWSIDSPTSTTYGNGGSLTFMALSKTAGVTSSTPENAAGVYLYKADTAGAVSLAGATAIENGAAVVMGRNYSYKTEDGDIWFFTATRSGTVALDDKYVFYDDTPVTGYVTLSSSTGVYKIETNTPAGGYIVQMTASDGNGGTAGSAWASFVVNQRAVTLQLPTKVGSEGVDETDPTLGELPVASGSFAPCDYRDGALSSDIADTLVALTYTNTAGKTFTNTGVDATCGYYTTSRATTSTLHGNYTLSFLGGSVSILGATYNLILGARPFENGDVGTVYVVSPDYDYTRSALTYNSGTDTYSSADVTLNYQAGTRVVFYAVPDSGYEVYDWYVGGVAQHTTATSLPYVMYAQDTRVEVQFAVKQSTLIFGTAGDADGGTLSCSDTALSSGSIVLGNSKFTFTAAANEGYHFKEWRYTEIGSGTAYDNEDEGKAASTFYFTMPIRSCTLYAVFERDFYTLTLNDLSGKGGITAWYYASAADAAAGEKTWVTGTTASVKGGTEVTVQPATGFLLDDNYSFVSQGSQGTADYTAGTYKLIIAENTVVNCKTRQQDFNITLNFNLSAVTAQPSDALIDASVAGIVHSFNYNAGTTFSIPDVAGGSSLSVSGSCADYYELEGWESSLTSPITAVVAADLEGAGLASWQSLATAAADGGAVVKDSIYKYTYDSSGTTVTCYFKATENGKILTDGGTVHVIASGDSYDIDALGSDVTLTLYLTEKPVHTVTLGTITNGTYSYSLPLGATQNEDKSVVTLHDGDDFSVTVTPVAGKTVTYWVVSYTPGSTLLTSKYRATSSTYTMEDIGYDYTVTPEFAASIYNTVSWPTIDSTINGITLTPANGSLSSVASGSSFSFKLEGAESALALIDRVYANGYEFTAAGNLQGGSTYKYDAATKVYTISNITANQVVTLTFKEIGLAVNGTDISAFSGTGWTYDAGTQVLTLTSGARILSGSNSQTYAPRLTILLDTGVGTVTFDNLTVISSAPGTLVSSKRTTGVSVTATGSNTLTANTGSTTTVILFQTVGDLTVRGAGALTLNVNRAYGNTSMKAVYCGGKLLVTGNVDMTVNAPKASDGTNSSFDNNVGIRCVGLTVGVQDSETVSPTLKVYMYGSDGQTLQSGYRALGILAEGDTMTVWSGKLLVCAYYGLLDPYHFIYNFGGFTEINSLGGAIYNPQYAYWLVDYSPAGAVKPSGFLACYGPSDTNFVTKTFGTGNDDKIYLDGFDWWDDFLDLFGLHTDDTSPLESKYLYIASASKSEPGIKVKVTDPDPDDPATSEGSVALSTGAGADGTYYYYNNGGALTGVDEDDLTLIKYLTAYHSSHPDGMRFYSKYDDGVLTLQEYELTVDTAVSSDENVDHKTELQKESYSTAERIFSASPYSPVIEEGWYYYFNDSDEDPRYLYFRAMASGFVASTISNYLADTVTVYPYGAISIDPVNTDDLAYTLSQVDGGLDISSLSAASLTLNGLTAATLSVDDSCDAFEIYGNNYLAGSAQDTGVLSFDGDALTVLSDGTGTLSAINAATGTAYGMKLNSALLASLQLNNVKSLSAYGATTGIYAPTGYSVRYYDDVSDEEPDDNLRDAFGIYGYGWLADSGSSSATAATRKGSDVGKISVTGAATPYVRYYRTTTDAACDKALDYDKNPAGTSALDTKVYCPAVVGQNHLFDFLKLSDGASSVTLVKDTDYTWTSDTSGAVEAASGTLTLLADGALAALDVGSYTLTASFYDEDTADATYYTLDIPLTVKDSLASVGNELYVDPTVKLLSRGGSCTFTTTFTGTTPKTYKWYLDDVQIDGAEGSSYKLSIASEAAFKDYSLKVEAYETAGAAVPMDTATATFTVLPKAASIAISCPTETPSGDGTYTLYHNTQNSWDFDAAVTLDDGNPGSDVVWSLWGAQLRLTTVNSTTGVLSIAQNETGTGGILKLTATHTNAAGVSLAKTVTIYLSTDAYIAYSNTDGDHGDITSVYYGEAQNTIPAVGTWIPVGSTVTAVAAPDTDYNVKSWSVKNGGVAIDKSLLTVSADGKTLTFTAGSMGSYLITAEYVNKYNFTITYSAGTHGSLTAAKDGTTLTSGGTVPINTSVTFTAAPDTYYKVKGWTVDGIPYEEIPGTAYDGTTLTLSDILANHVVTVEFEGVPVTVTYVAGINADDTSAPNGTLNLFYDGVLVSDEPEEGGDRSLTYEAEIPAMGEVNILANPDEGYQVKCWYIWSGAAYAAVNSSNEVANYYLPEVTGDLKVKVEFEEIPLYNVTVSSDSYQNGGGSVASGVRSISTSGSMVVSVKNHGNLTLLATPDAGSYLYEWRIDGADYVTDGNSVTLINLTGDATVAAVFRKAFYDVSLKSGEGGSMTAHYSLADDLSSGDIGDGESAAIKSGSTVVASIFPDADFTIDTLTVNEDPVELTISGTPGSYSYTFEIPELLADTDIAVTFKECVYYTVTAPDGDNFELLISGGDTPEDEADDVYAPAGAAEAGFVTDGFSHLDGAAAIILEGGAATLAFTPAAGVNAYVDTDKLCDEVEDVLSGAESNASYRIYLDGTSYVVELSGIDKTLDFSLLDNVFALWTDDVDEYSVTFGKDGSGAVTAIYDGMSILSGTKLPVGSTVVIKFTPQAHYALTELTDDTADVLGEVDFSGTTGTYTVEIADDIDLFATFEVAEYPVTIVKLGTGNGTVTAAADGDALTASCYLPVGSSVSITAAPNTGSAFNCMAVGSTPVDGNAYTIASLDGPVTITAVFDAVSKIVTYSKPANGTLKVTDSQGNTVTSGQSVAVGTVLVITATPNAHYVLDSLSAGGSSITGNTYTVDASKTNLIEAYFELAQVKVTWSVPENGTLKVYAFDGTELSSGDYVAVGEKIRIVAAPKNENYKLDTLKMNGSGITSGNLYTIPAKDVTLSATFKYVGDAPSGGGGGGGGGSTTIINEIVPLAALETIDVLTTDGGLTALGTVTESDDKIIMDVDGGSFEELALYAKSKNTGITFRADLAAVTFDNKAVEYINGIADSGNVILTVSEVGTDNLSAANRKTVGSHPVYEFALTAGDVGLNTFGGGKVKISIPYTLKSGETSETVVVYYIDAAGTLKTIRGAYHADTGTVDFPITHFSSFSLGNNPVYFNDVPDSVWYYKPVTFVAARGITLGIGGGLFGPDKQITRGEFIVMLMRAYGIEPDTSPTDNFADAGNDYYTNYLAAAKRLGITKGIGDNLYAPAACISRQDIFTLLYRALDVLGELPAKTKTVDLSTFADYVSISDYALTAVKTFVEAGVVSGSDGLLAPTSLSTRAQMAQVLYNLLTK